MVGELRRGATLETNEVSVRFGGLAALTAVTLSAEPGRVTGLIGPNGAGKTTTFNVLCGLQPTTAGQVSIDGVDITSRSPHQRARLGIARTFQRLETFSLLTVRENVLAGAELRGRAARKSRDVQALTDTIVERLGLGDVADLRVDSLPTGRARLVEIGRALANDPRILLLDEPSSGLNELETSELAAVLGELAADGLTVLMVEHDMSLVMGTCEVIHVLDFGRIIASGTPEQTQANAHVRAAYLGDASTSSIARSTATSSLVPAPEDRESVPMLAVRGVSAGYGEFDVIDDVSLDVAGGEVFALLGPNGAGKSTLLKVIAGLLEPSSGQVTLSGRNVVGANAEDLARAGVCLIPEGRGVFPSLSVAENLWMASFSGTPRDVIEQIAYDRFPRLAERRSQPAGTLSGGEQQMLAMARALATDPALLILDELSMGLAPIIVGDLYETVAEIAQEGLAILVVEQFAQQVLGVADMAAIMLHGKIRRVGEPAAIAEELASAYLSGVVASP